MKNKVSYLLTAAIAVLLFASCKKDEHKIYFEDGTPPVLTASATGPLVLTKASARETAVKLTWTNPNYRFTTGISSQDVTYILQVDTTGASFGGPHLQEASFARDLEATYTDTLLNSVLAKMELVENIPHNIEMRLKATLAGGTVPLYSNVIKMTITPYLDVAVPIPPTGELYITGNAMASDWTNSPPTAQKFTKLSITEYTITVPFVSGKYYKFLSNLGQWQPQYGGKVATGGNLGYNMGLPGQSDPDAIPTPDVAGNYKIIVNFKTGLYTVAKQ